MPSLTDIPEDLKSSDKKDQFLEWVFELAVDFNVGRSLIHLWSRLTRTKLTPDEWLKVEAKLREPGNV